MERDMRSKSKKKKTAPPSNDIKRTLKREIVKFVDNPPPPPEIIDLVKDPAVDPAKLKALLDMRNSERMHAAANAYAVAMSDVQALIEPVRKDCENKETRSKYASFTALDRAIRKNYVDHGFALSYNTEPLPQADHM